MWLSHNALSSTKTSLLFPFLSYITLILRGLPHLFASFLSGTVPLFFVWMSHNSPVCPLSYLCVNVTHARLHFLCVNVTQISLSPLLLCGHSTLFPFRSWLTHSRSNLVWTATPHFLNEKFTRAASFPCFDNIMNLFITTFIFPM